ncbi:MAG TPA: hypothetical protein VKB19_01155 [Pedobacter sp.]|nr:hypothetical protein [Pedobacter sp.]
MKSMLFNASRTGSAEAGKPAIVFMILLLIWPLLQGLIVNMDLTVGIVDPNVVLLVLLSLICLMGLVGLCWWLFSKFLLVLGLPDCGSMVSRFNELVLWQRFVFYYGVYALLLLAGVGCLVAIL